MVHGVCESAVGGDTPSQLMASPSSLPLSSRPPLPLPAPQLTPELTMPADPLAAMPDELSRAIVEAEQTNAWTLMHRFNKATDLLFEVRGACNH